MIKDYLRFDAETKICGKDGQVGMGQPSLKLDSIIGRHR